MEKADRAGGAHHPSSALSMQERSAVGKQMADRARALDLLRLLRENLSVSNPKHLLGREPESVLLIAIPYFISCPVFAGDLNYFHCSYV